MQSNNIIQFLVPAPHHSSAQLIQRPAQVRQSGAALIVCLILMAVLLIISLGSISDVGLQSAMIRNNQMYMVSYNTAMSEINGQINKVNYNSDSSKLLAALNSGYVSLSGADLTMDGVIYGSSTTVDQSGTQITYQGSGLAPGASESLLQALNYTIDSSAQVSGGRSDQVQGVYYIAPN